MNPLRFQLLAMSCRLENLLDILTLCWALSPQNRPAWLPPEIVCFPVDITFVFLLKTQNFLSTWTSLLEARWVSNMHQVLSRYWSERIRRHLRDLKSKVWCPQSSFADKNIYLWGDSDTYSKIRSRLGHETGWTLTMTIGVLFLWTRQGNWTKLGTSLVLL